MTNTDTLACVVDQRLSTIDQLIISQTKTIQLLTNTLIDTQSRLAHLEATQGNTDTSDVIATIAVIISLFAAGFTVYQYRKQTKNEVLFHLIKDITDANTTFRNALVDVKNGNWTTDQAKEYRTILAMDILLKSDHACKFYLNDRVDKEKFDFHLKVDIVSSYTQLISYTPGTYPNLVQYCQPFLLQR